MHIIFQCSLLSQCLRINGRAFKSSNERFNWRERILIPLLKVCSNLRIHYMKEKLLMLLKTLKLIQMGQKFFHQPIQISVALLIRCTVIKKIFLKQNFDYFSTLTMHVSTIFPSWALYDNEFKKIKMTLSEIEQDTLKLMEHLEDIYCRGD